MTQGIDLLVSFDTTGSMYPVLSEVRSQVVKFVDDMFNSVEDLRVGIIAHGDYCDKDNPYTIRCLDLTTDRDKICDFVRTTKSTYGGDAPECYELVLNTSRTVVNWGAGRSKLLVLIGDANPHEVGYVDNVNRLDWRNEAKLLEEMGVKIFAVHALSFYRRESYEFYHSLAEYTHGTYLTLDQFNEIMPLIKATALSEYSEEKINEYVSVIKSTGHITRTMAANINRLTGKETIAVPDVYRSPASKYGYSARTATPDGLVAVDPGRFQVFTVDSDCDIRQFVTDRGIEFNPGRGFYELKKYVKVQQHKEIILQDRETGEFFHGSQVREKLGLLPHDPDSHVNESLSSKNLDPKYKIFIQSTSYNRKLLAGTDFLYEVSDI